MFAGEHFCKLDEKGRFLLPPSIRDLLCPEGQAEARAVILLKRSEPTCLRAYTQTEWNGVLTQTRSRLDEDQSRLFMHHVVSETSTSELDKAGRILIPGKFRKHLNLADDQEIVLVGMFEFLEVWNPVDWRRRLTQAEDRYEASMSKIMDILDRR